METHGGLREFLRLLYATFERQRDLFGTFPNFYWANHFVATLLALNMVTLFSIGMKVAGLSLPPRGNVGTWLGIGLVMVIVSLWVTRGLEDSPATTAVRDALDRESPSKRLVRRIKVGGYVLISIGAFGYAIFAT